MAHDSGRPPGKQTSYKITSRRRSNTQPIGPSLNPFACKGSSHAEESGSPCGSLGTQDPGLGLPRRNSCKVLNESEDRPPVAHISRSRSHRQVPILVAGESPSNEGFSKQPGNIMKSSLDDKRPVVSGAASSKYQQEYFKIWLDAQQKTLTDALQKFGMTPEQVTNTRAACLTRTAKELQQAREQERRSAQVVAADPPVCVQSSSPFCNVSLKQRAKSEPAVNRKSMSQTFCKISPPRVDFDRQSEILITPRALSEKRKSKLDGDMRPCRHPVSPKPKTRSKQNTSPSPQSAKKPRPAEPSPNCAHNPRLVDETKTPPSTNKARPVGIPISYSVQHDKHKNKKNKSNKSKSKMSRKPVSQGISPTKIITPIPEFYEPPEEASETCEKIGGFRFGSIQHENPKSSEDGQKTPAKFPFIGNYAACYDLPRTRDTVENEGDYTTCSNPEYCPRICGRATQTKTEEGQKVLDQIMCESEIKATNQGEVITDVPEVRNPCEKRCTSPFCKRRKNLGEHRGTGMPMKTGSILSGVVSAFGSQFQTIACRNMKFYGFPGMQGLFNPESTMGRLFYPQDHEEVADELEEGDGIRETVSPTVTKASVASAAEQESLVSERIREGRRSIDEEADEEESNQGQVGILRTSKDQLEEDARTSVRMSSTIQSTSSREGKGTKSTKDYKIESVVEIEGRPSKRSSIEERSSKRSLLSSQRLSEPSAGRGSQASLQTVESVQSGRSQKAPSTSRFSGQSGLKSATSKHEDYLQEVSEGDEVSVRTSGAPETLTPIVEDTLDHKLSTTKRISAVSNNLSPSTSATLGVKAGPRTEEEEGLLSDEELKTVTGGSPRSQVSERREKTYKGDREIIVEAKQSFTISEKSESARDGPTSGVNESPGRSSKRQDSGAAQRIENSQSWSLSDGKLRYEAKQTVEQSEESDEQTIALSINQKKQSRGSWKEMNEIQEKTRSVSTVNDNLYKTSRPEIQQDKKLSSETVQVTQRGSAGPEPVPDIAQSNQEVVTPPNKSLLMSSITSLPATVKSLSRQEPQPFAPDSPNPETPDLAVPSQASGQSLLPKNDGLIQSNHNTPPPVSGPSTPQPQEMPPPSQASIKSGRSESRGSLQLPQDTPPHVSAPTTPQSQDMAPPSQTSVRIARPNSGGSLRSSGVSKPPESTHSLAAGRKVSVTESIRAQIREGTVSAHTFVTIHSRESTTQSPQRETLNYVHESRDLGNLSYQSEPPNVQSSHQGSIGLNRTSGNTLANEENEQFFSPQPSRGGSQELNLTAQPPQLSHPPSQRTSQQSYLTAEPTQPSHPPSQKTSQQTYLTAEPTQPSHPPSQRTSQHSYLTAEPTQPSQPPSQRTSQHLYLTTEPTQPSQQLSRGASIQSYLTAEPTQRFNEDFQSAGIPEASLQASSYDPGDCLHSIATVEPSPIRSSRPINGATSIQQTLRPDIVQRTSITPEIRQFSGLSISEEMVRHESFDVHESQLTQKPSKKSVEEIESYRRASTLHEPERRNPTEQLSSLPKRMSLISDADRVSISKIEEQKFANNQLPVGGSGRHNIPDTQFRGDGTRPQSFEIENHPTFPCRKFLALSDFQRSEICARRSFELPEERKLQEPARPPSFEISKYEKLTLLERDEEECWARAHKGAPSGAPSVHQVSIIMKGNSACVDHRRAKCIQVCSTVGAPVSQVMLKTRDCSEFSSGQTDDDGEYGPRRGSTSSSERERDHLYQSSQRKRKQDPRSSAPAPKQEGHNYRSRESDQSTTKRPVSNINRASDPDHRCRKSAKEDSAVGRNAPYYETTTTERSLSSHISDAGHTFRTEDEMSRSDNVQVPPWPVRNGSKRDDWRERGGNNDELEPDDQSKFSTKMSKKMDPYSPKKEWIKPNKLAAEEPDSETENPFNEHADEYMPKRENFETWSPSRTSPPRSKKCTQARSASSRDRKGEKCKMDCGEYHITVTSSNISTSPRSECSSVTVKLRPSEDAARKSIRQSDLDDYPDPARTFCRSLGSKQAPSSRPHRDHDSRDNSQSSQPPVAYSYQNTRYPRQPYHKDSGSTFKSPDYGNPQDGRDGDAHSQGRPSKTRRTEADRYGVNSTWARRSDFGDPDNFETEGRKSRLSRPSWGRQILSKQHSLASQPVCVTFPHELSETSSETFSRADRLIREAPQKTIASHTQPSCEFSHPRLTSRQGYSLSERDKIKQAQSNSWNDQLQDSSPYGLQRCRRSSKRSILSVSSHSITGEDRARSRHRRELTSKETERYIRKLQDRDQTGHMSSSPARSSYSGSTSLQPTTDLGSGSADELEHSHYDDNAQQLQELRYKQKCAEEELKKIRGRITFRYTDGPRCTNPTLEIQKGRLRMVASPAGAKCFKCDSSHHLGDGPGRVYSKRPTSNEVNGSRTRERRKCLEGFLSDSCMDRYEPESKNLRGKSWKLSNYCGDLSSLGNKSHFSNLNQGKSSNYRARGINIGEGLRRSPTREHFRLYRLSPESRRSPYPSARGNRSRCNSTSRDPDSGMSEVGEAIDQFQQIITPDCSGPVCSGDWPIGSDGNTASTKFCSYTARMATSAVSKISPQRSDKFATRGAGYFSPSEDISCVEELTLVNTQIFTCQRRSSQKGASFLSSKTAQESRTFKRSETDPGPSPGQNQTVNAYTKPEPVSRTSNGLWSQSKGGENSSYTTSDKGDDSSEIFSETWHQCYDQNPRLSFTAPGQRKLHNSYYAQSGLKFPEDRSKNTNCSSNSQKGFDSSDESDDSERQKSLERVDNFHVVKDGLAISVSPKTEGMASDLSHVNLGQPEGQENRQLFVQVNCASDQFLKMISRTNRNASEYVSLIAADCSSSPEKVEVVGNLENWLREIRDSSSQSSLCSDHLSRPSPRPHESLNTPTFNALPSRSGKIPYLSSRAQSISRPVSVDASLELSRSDLNVGDSNPRSESGTHCEYNQLQETTEITSAVTTTLTRLISSKNSKSRKSSRNTNSEQTKDVEQFTETMPSQSNPGLILCRTELSCHQQLNFRVALSKRLGVRKEVVLVPLHYGTCGFSITESNITKNANSDFPEETGLFLCEHSTGISERQNNTSQQPRVNFLSRKKTRKGSKETLQSPKKIIGSSKDIVLVYVISSGLDKNENKTGFKRIIQSDADNNSAYSSRSTGTTTSTLLNQESDKENGADNLVKGKAYHFFTKQEFFSEFGLPHIPNNHQDNRRATKHRDKHRLPNSARDAVSDCVNCGADSCQDRNYPTRQILKEEPRKKKSKSKRRNRVAKTSIKQIDISQVGTTFHGVAQNDEDVDRGKVAKYMLFRGKQSGSVCMNLNNSVLLQGDYEDCQQLIGSSHICHHAGGNEARCNGESKSFYLHDERDAPVPELPIHHGGTGAVSNPASFLKNQRPVAKDHASKLYKITNSKGWWSSPPPLGLVDLVQDRAGSRDPAATSASRLEQFLNSNGSGTARVCTSTSPSLGDKSRKQYPREMYSFKTSPISRSTLLESHSFLDRYDVSGSASHISRDISSKVSSPDNDDSFRESPDFDRFINQPNPLGLLQGKLKVFFDTAIEKWTSPNLTKCSQMTGKNQKQGEPLNTTDNTNLSGTKNEFSLNSTFSEEENENGSGILDPASPGTDSQISITEESVELMSMLAETESTSTPDNSLETPACVQDGEHLANLVGKLMKRTERKKARRLLRRQKYARALLKRWILMRQRDKLQQMSRSGTDNCIVKEEPESRLESSQSSPKSRFGEMDKYNARCRRKYKVVEDEETRSRSPIRHRSSSRPSRLRSFRKPEILSGRAKYVSAVPLSAYLSKSAELFTRSRSRSSLQRCQCQEKRIQKAKTITLKVCSNHDFKTKKTKAKGVQVPCSPSQVYVTVATSRNSEPRCQVQTSRCENHKRDDRPDCNCGELPRRDRSPPKIERCKGSSEFGYNESPRRHVSPPKIEARYQETPECGCNESPRRNRSPPKIETRCKDSSDCGCNESPRRDRTPPKIETRCKDSSDCGYNESPRRNISPPKTEAHCIDLRGTSGTAGFLSCTDDENEQYRRSNYKKSCQACEQSIANDCPCRKSESTKRKPNFHSQLLRSLAIKSNTNPTKFGPSRQERNDTQDCKCLKPCSLTPILEESRSKEQSSSEKSRSEDPCTSSSYFTQENIPCHCTESGSKTFSLSDKAPDCSRKSPKVSSPKHKKLSPPQKISIKVINNSEAEHAREKSRRKQASSSESRSCKQTKSCGCCECRATKKLESRSEWNCKQKTQKEYKVNVERKLDEMFPPACRGFERCRKPEVERRFACDEDREYYLKWKDITEKYYGPSKVVDELPLKLREFKSLRGTDFMDSLKSKQRANFLENRESGYRTRAVSWDNPTPTSKSILRDERGNRPLPTRLHVDSLRELIKPQSEPFYVPHPFVSSADDAYKNNLNMKSNILKEAGKPSKPIFNSTYGGLCKERTDSCTRSCVSGFDVPLSNQYPLPASPKSWKLASDPYLQPIKSTNPQFHYRSQVGGYRPQVDTRRSRCEQILKPTELDADFFKYLESRSPFKSAFLRKEIEVSGASSATQAMSTKKEEDLMNQYLGKRGNGFFRMARRCGASYRTSRNTNINRTSGGSSDVTETSPRRDVIHHETVSRASETDRHKDHSVHRKDLSSKIPSNNYIVNDPLASSESTEAFEGITKENNKASSNLNFNLPCQSSEDTSQPKSAIQNESNIEGNQNANNCHRAFDADLQTDYDDVLMDEERTQICLRKMRKVLRDTQKMFGKLSKDFLDKQEDFTDIQKNFRDIRNKNRDNQKYIRDTQKDFKDTEKYFRNTRTDFRDTRKDIKNTHNDFRVHQQDVLITSSGIPFGNNMSSEQSLLNARLEVRKKQHMYETLDSQFYLSSHHETFFNCCQKGDISRSNLGLKDRIEANSDKTIFHNIQRTFLDVRAYKVHRPKRAGRTSMAPNVSVLMRAVSLGRSRKTFRSIKCSSAGRFQVYLCRVSYRIFCNSAITVSSYRLLQFDGTGLQRGRSSCLRQYWISRLVLEVTQSMFSLEASGGKLSLSRFWAVVLIGRSGNDACWERLSQVRQKRSVKLSRRATMSSVGYVGSPPVLDLDTLNSRVLQSPNFDPGDSRVLPCPNDYRGLAINNGDTTVDFRHVAIETWTVIELEVVNRGCLKWITVVLHLIRKTREDVFQPVSLPAQRMR